MTQPTHTPNPGDLHDEQIVALLRSGAHAMLLSAYFGEFEYRELCQYAKLAATRAKDDGPTVYILPGIMGSKLSAAGDHVPHVVWLHPTSIANGSLMDLAQIDGNGLIASGVMLPGYLKLKLRLEIAGFRPLFYPFDWRCDLFELARRLIDHMTRAGEEHVSLVAHSMGGLVARAALALDTDRRIRTLVQLGAPNDGSFAPVQALRAVYPTVRKIAALDHSHSAEELAREVFLRLPGLYQMLPSAELAGGLNLFDVSAWPQDDLMPQQALLASALECRKRLPRADARCSIIVGTQQETITALRTTQEGFEYTVTRSGDGTVPVQSAQWPSARTWYVSDTHGGMTNNNTVLSAVIDLLRTDTTRQLTSQVPTLESSVVRVITDKHLRAQATHKVQWDTLSLDSRRRILEPVLTPEFIG